MMLGLGEITGNRHASRFMFLRMSMSVHFVKLYDCVEHSRSLLKEP